MTDFEYDMVIDNISQNTFHMTDEQAKIVIDEYLEIYPELLERATREFYYKIKIIS